MDPTSFENAVKIARKDLKPLLDAIVPHLKGNAPQIFNLRSAITGSFGTPLFYSSADFSENARLIRGVASQGVLQNIELFLAYDEPLELPRNNILHDLLRQLREVILRESNAEAADPYLLQYRKTVKLMNELYGKLPTAEDKWRLLGVLSETLDKLWFLITKVYFSQ